ncbi:carbohydrate ABC transporter permease [Halosimplex aquaticum]|uniref:Carbohydrate ABC transporter permease n=1 Tax=Halosimplex aquaticum TaxID=3026162 RepID=A0ABD5Y461_9EURY|nr:carbohydrate ABC transporter permease [Halosimplex aquaticum]
MSKATASTDESFADILPELDYWKIALSLVITFFFAFFLAPIWTGLVTSFKTSAAVTGTTPFVPPGAGGFTLQKWGRAANHLSTGFINSLIMTIPSTIATVFLGSTAAYGLTLVDWGDRAQFGVLILFLVGIFIPYQAVLVPLSDFWINVFPLAEILAPVWELSFLEYDHARLLALTITHVVYGIPICMLLFRGYYMTLSEELVEAAKIDGATITTIYRRIVLPLSKPMIGVVFIYQFTMIWNEFLFSLTLIGSSSSPAATVTLVLSGLGTDLSGIDFGLRMAGALFAALPTIIIYVLFAEQFAKGLASDN